ncbi:hypothetical protein JRO89_XS02G0040700 [Xanthoceras sorbifolium]|uniref:Uncharacterized protein n=1 Tax=Xanthoceras sorbifolium TaxID=99658 RepID=A0ABQ8IER1_9ROSI|nr:hypothetical protein JRO89_XS02G0040700 [Xanthoceras sorbifolium]
MGHIMEFSSVCSVSMKHSEVLSYLANISSNEDIEQSIHVDEEQSNEDVDNW